jgi:multidrug efflux pump subunit AcrA (membrane-fusion protein)
VNRIDPIADAETRQVAIHVRLPNPRGRIVGGQFAHGRIVLQGRVHALVVPETAVLGAGDSSLVFVLTGNTIGRRPVQTGVRDDRAGVVTITRGLTAGERVLVRPRIDLGDGTTVTVAADRPASAPASRSGAPTPGKGR